MKVAQVIWTSEAIFDLEVIYDFLADKSPSAAERITNRILERTRQLEEFPESGVIQETIALEKEYRYLVEGNYKIIYRYKHLERTIFVEVIFDAPQNPIDIWLWRLPIPQIDQAKAYHKQALTSNF